MVATPMFPLGSVLLPSMVLPLHVFEPRYRQLTATCIENDREFGVVLIERGSEVGGGDTRTSVGTLARIVQSQAFPDGRWALVAVGTRRIRVHDWLPDDPYPLADVEPMPDTPASADAPAALDRVVATLRTVLARAVELGAAAAPATTELADDVTLASYQAGVLAPIGPADRQRLLEADGPDARLAMLQELLDDELRFLDARIAMDRDDPPAPGAPGAEQ
jgi:Lon protease-like protein